MRLGYPSLAIRSTVGVEPEFFVVTATDALRLCRREGYEALPSHRARPWVDSVVRTDLAQVRAFLEQARLPRPPAGRDTGTDVLARLNNALRTRDLVVVRQVGRAAGGDGVSADLRRLVRAIDDRTRGRLSFGGRQYKLVADLDLPRLRNRDSYEVVRKAEALRIMGELAAHGDGHADGLAALLGEASAKLTADWRPPLFPDGIILLRRIPVLASASDLAPAITPSQLKQMMGKSDFIEFEVTDDEGEPYAARYRIELSDGQKLEGRLGPDGFFGKYDIDSGNCQLVLLTGLPLSGSFVEDEPDEPAAAEANQEPAVAEAAETAACDPSSLPDVPLPPPPSAFAVTVVDEQGRPLAGLGLRFNQGIAAGVATTDAAGVARYEGLEVPAQVSFADPQQVADVVAATRSSQAAPVGGSFVPPASDVTVVVSRPGSLEDADGATFTSFELAAGETRTLSIQPGMRRAVLLELHDALFRTDSAVVNPEGEAPSDAVASHEALTSVGLIATALRYNQEHPGKKLFVAGHADRAGSEANNVTLSEHRARAVLALLEGDKAAYVAACKAKHSEVDVTQLFDWTHNHPSFLFKCSPTTLKAAPSNENYYLFRTSYNQWVNGAPTGEVRGTPISPTGRLMDDIWSAMFDLYEYALREELAEEPDGVAALRGGAGLGGRDAEDGRLRRELPHRGQHPERHAQPGRPARRGDVLRCGPGARPGGAERRGHLRPADLRARRASPAGQRQTLDARVGRGGGRLAR